VAGIWAARLGAQGGGPSRRGHTGPDTEPLADKITKLSRFADAVIAKAPRSG
jgi:hypothetical protein